MFANIKKKVVRKIYVFSFKNFRFVNIFLKKGDNRKNTFLRVVLRLDAIFTIATMKGRLTVIERTN